MGTLSAFQTKPELTSPTFMMLTRITDDTKPVHFRTPPSPSPWVLTDMVDGSSAELAEKLFGAERLQVVYDHGPQVEHVVAAEAVSFLEHDDTRAEQLCLDGGAQTARAAADHQHLRSERWALGIWQQTADHQHLGRERWV